MTIEIEKDYEGVETIGNGDSEEYFTRISLSEPLTEEILQEAIELIRREPVFTIEHTRTVGARTSHELKP
jgi:hypothetical protein